MRVKMEKILPRTISVINRLKANDSETGRESFRVYKLDNCFWGIMKQSTQAGQAVNHGNKITVHIPKDQEFVYLSYDKWLTQPDDSFTLEVDDYIVQGEIKEDVTPDNITDILQQYAPNTCKIRMINDLTIPDGGLDHSGGFLLKFSDMIEVEGV